MKRIEQSVLLAGLLAFGLAACTTDRGASESTAAMATESRSEAYAIPPNGALTGTTPAAAAATTTPAAPTDPEAAMASAPNSMVTLIEIVPRQAGADTAAGTMAGAAVGGTGAAGTTATSDRVYRITLQMDDGTTRVITQEWAPTFRSGDRVTLTGNEIERR